MTEIQDYGTKVLKKLRLDKTWIAFGMAVIWKKIWNATEMQKQQL
jgi:hypothetical protein